MSGSALLAVGGLLALFVGLSFALRRLAAGRGPQNTDLIKVLGHRRLDAETWVWVIEIEGRRLLVGGGRGKLTLLGDLPEAAALGAADPEP